MPGADGTSPCPTWQAVLIVNDSGGAADAVVHYCSYGKARIWIVCALVQELAERRAGRTTIGAGRREVLATARC